MQDGGGASDRLLKLFATAVRFTTVKMRNAMKLQSRRSPALNPVFKRFQILPEPVTNQPASAMAAPLWVTACIHDRGFGLASTVSSGAPLHRDNGLGARVE